MRRIILMILVCVLMIAGTACGKAENGGTNMSMPIETVRTKDFSMDYFRFGRGEKTLVILPELSIDSVMKYADGVAEAYGSFAEDFTVYVFDRRKELPAYLEVLESDAFYNINAESVLIPAGVTSIEGNPFAESNVTTIVGVTGTEAETFANEYGYTFVSLE